MDIFSVLTLFGGLALFLYGMNVMGGALEKLAGSRLERILERLTDNPIKGVLLGFGVTAIIQSSSAVTVMVVGFVNAGIMKLAQAVGVIMGANIGTTVTAWILSLTGIQGDSVFVRLLKPESFSPILAVVGIVLIMFAKRDRKKDIGSILVGFAVLMFGMSTMSNAVSPLADVPEFQQVFVMFSNPFLGVLMGAALTAIIQSSSASVGILQALSITGSVTYGSAIPIIMGQNIGTCVTALISSIGANKNAKRAAMVHLYFNIIGTVLFLILFYSLNAIFHFDFVSQSLDPVGIAIIHTTFNLLSTAVLLPFSSKLAKLATLTVRDGASAAEQDEPDMPFLDERFLNTPSFAVEQCRNTTVQMAQLTRRTIFAAIDGIGAYTPKLDEQIRADEDRLDLYEDKLGTYLVKLSSKELSERDSNEISKLLHSIGDFERIGDHAVNMLVASKELWEKQLRFSEKAQRELDVMRHAVHEIVDTTIDAFVNEDLSLAAKVEPLEQVIDELDVEIKTRHIERLTAGECTIELGFILSDILGNYERISDHCSNIAVCIIQTENAMFETHGYLNEIKTSGDVGFLKDFNQYRSKYALPSHQ